MYIYTIKFGAINCIKQFAMLHLQSRCLRKRDSAPEVDSYKFYIDHSEPIYIKMDQIPPKGKKFTGPGPCGYRN